MSDHVLSNLLRRLRGSFIAAGIFSIFFNVLVLTIPIYMMSIFTRVMSSKSEETLVLLSVAAAVALAMQALLDFLRSRLAVNISLALDAHLSPQVLEAVLRQAAGSAQRNSQRLRDASELRNFLNSSAVFAFVDIPFVPLYVLVIFLLHPALGTLALGGSLLLLGVAFANELATRKPLKETLQLNRQALGRVEICVRNADVIAAMGMMPAILLDWRTKNVDTLSAMSSAGARGTMATSSARFLRTMLQVGIYGLGSYLYIENAILPGAIIAASILMGRALAPAETAISAWRNIVSARAAYQRLHEVLSTERLGRYRDRTSLPDPEGKLVVERVVVKAPGSDKMILKSVSFHLAPGQFIGVVGPSGAGKTTLGKVIVGILRPTAGAARLDGADLADWNPDELGRHIGYLPQDVQLFAGTVRDNIARLSRDGDSRAVVAAAQAAGVHQMILGLPNGYETDIGDAGNLLSAGQRQHIALARALYGSPRLLVLDEPNSNLDSMSERALVNALGQAKKRGVTIVVITHRPKILGSADKMLVLQDGRVDVCGKRVDVMARLNPGAARENDQQRMKVVKGDGQ